ncbi:MAG: aromatic amino acid hydroxylase [Polyangiaceae bacterium]
MMPHVAEKVPAHLRRFVVQQDYSQYTPADQAVWRFVLLQMHARLRQTAHPAYREGLAATGISVDRIPGIDEMNEKLSRFGWSAVCVDGFIPPRAFQEFQASAILPIAADVRSRAHLAYTPAPDILHEAAGHAPILPDPVFASYLRRIGELGKKAFALPEEDRVFRAVYTLSEVKEDPAATPAIVAAAEAELRSSLAAATEPSEAALLSRLYWWTAEYGLVGRPDDYKLYGAGLLSSLGESHSCHSPAVRKVVLDERCVDVAYDITQPQPQLFVAPSFDALHEVLERVASTMAFRRGGALALARALRSGEVATVQFASGASVIGVVREVGPSGADPAYLEMGGPTAIAWDGTIEAALEPYRGVERLVVVGRLAGGVSLDAASDDDLRSRLAAGSGRHRFAFDRGAVVEGELLRAVRRPDGRLMLLDLAGAHITLPGSAPRDVPRYALLATGDVVTAHAGAVDARYYGDTPFSPVRIPRPRDYPPEELAMLDLYARAEDAHGKGPEAMADVFPAVHATLTRDFPREWLLRWNLLESLLRAAPRNALVQTLWAELDRLEVVLDRKQPIASGLRYLA